MRMLLTNDDGIEAPGLRALSGLVEELGAVVVAAPEDERSACGHTATTRSPIRVLEEEAGRYRVCGTPVDCVRLGLTELAPETEWVFSGINAGGNVGIDLYMSGTVAAAREAALLGRRAVALSQYVRRNVPLDWELTVERLRPVLRMVLERPYDPGTFWNVNLPHPDSDSRELDVVFCDPDILPLEVRFEREGEHFHYRGDYHARRHDPGKDVAVVFGGRIAVSRVKL